MIIACIGDSCTFGQNVRADEAWPHLLWEMTGHDVRNLGVNGDTTRLGLERWHRDVDLSKPDVVVIQFGHNDANLWNGRPRVSSDAYLANVAEMVSLSPRAIVLAPHPSTVEKDPDYNDRLGGYTYEGAPFLVVGTLDDGYGVHPSAEGHRLYAEYVVGQL